MKYSRRFFVLKSLKKFALIDYQIRSDQVMATVIIQPYTEDAIYLAFFDSMQRIISPAYTAEQDYVDGVGFVYTWKQQFVILKIELHEIEYHEVFSNR